MKMNLTMFQRRKVFLTKLFLKKNPEKSFDLESIPPFLIYIAGLPLL
jgi:hypothetical protein